MKIVTFSTRSSVIHRILIHLGDTDTTGRAGPAPCPLAPATRFAAARSLTADFHDADSESPYPAFFFRELKGSLDQHYAQLDANPDSSGPGK